MKRLFPARGTRGARRWNYCPVHPIVNGLMYPSRHIEEGGPEGPPLRPQTSGRRGRPSVGPCAASV